MSPASSVVIFKGEDLPTAATHKVKSDTTHSDMTVVLTGNKRKSRLKSKIQTLSASKHYSHSPVAMRIIESPYLQHLGKGAVTATLNKDLTIAGMKSIISHGSAMTSLHEGESSLMGRGVRSRGKSTDRR